MCQQNHQLLQYQLLRLFLGFLYYLERQGYQLHPLYRQYQLLRLFQGYQSHLQYLGYQLHQLPHHYLPHRYFLDCLHYLQHLGCQDYRRFLGRLGLIDLLSIRQPVQRMKQGHCILY